MIDKFLVIECGNCWPVLISIGAKGRRPISLHESDRSKWPSGLRRYMRNRKDPGSNPTKFSAGHCDPTSLRGSR